VDALRVHGVDRVFCVPGESYLDFLDALYDHQEIQIVVAKHEGAAANMAETDGKLTGRPGICRRGRARVRERIFRQPARGTAPNAGYRRAAAASILLRQGRVV
jgi:hypothetical protein